MLIYFMELECSQWYCNEISAVSVIGFTLPEERSAFKEEGFHLSLHEPDSSLMCTYKA